MSLPERGMLEPVRVCISCYNEVYYKQMLHGTLIDRDDSKDDVPIPAKTSKRQEMAELLHAEFVEHSIAMQPGEEMKMHLPQTYFYAQDVSRVSDVDTIPRVGDPVLSDPVLPEDISRMPNTPVASARTPSKSVSAQSISEQPAALATVAPPDQPPLWCGTLVVTNYRVCYLPTRGSRLNPSGWGIQAMTVRLIPICLRKQPHCATADTDIIMYGARPVTHVMFTALLIAAGTAVNHIQSAHCIG